MVLPELKTVGLTAKAVELAGLEPATSWVRFAPSPFCLGRLGLFR
jgi:hypothetical protein